MIFLRSALGARHAVDRRQYRIEHRRPAVRAAGRSISGEQLRRRDRGTSGGRLHRLQRVWRSRSRPRSTARAGRTTSCIASPEQRSHPRLVLKHGLSPIDGLWGWHQDVVGGEHSAPQRHDLSPEQGAGSGAVVELPRSAAAEMDRTDSQCVDPRRSHSRASSWRIGARSRAANNCGETAVPFAIEQLCQCGESRSADSSDHVRDSGHGLAGAASRDRASRGAREYSTIARCSARTTVRAPGAARRLLDRLQRRIALGGTEHRELAARAHRPIDRPGRASGGSTIAVTRLAGAARGSTGPVAPQARSLAIWSRGRRPASRAPESSSLAAPRARLAHRR